MSPDGNAISSFPNDVFHPLYPRSSGLSHRATITVVVVCSVFGFLLFMFFWLCCCIRSRRRASASYGPHELAEEGSEFTGKVSKFTVQGDASGAAFNPNQLWTPTQAERDLEYAASQVYQGWTIGRDIPRSEQNLTATELVTGPPHRVSEASASSVALPAPQFPLPMSIQEPQQAAIPNEEQPSPTSAIFTQPPTFTCCSNTFRTRAEYNRHRRYHDKPETCPHCQRSFGTTRDINRHVNQVHQMTKVWFCLEASCKHSRASGGKGFPRKDNWRRHMRDAHGVEAN